jgi:hypothetical protein
MPFKECMSVRPATNARDTITRRRSLELLGVGFFMTTTLGVGHADDKFNTAPKVLFFSKSSSYEHDVVKRTDKAPSLAEAILTEIGRTHGFDVIATKDGRVFDSDLAQYDAFFFLRVAI